MLLVLVLVLMLVLVLLVLLVVIRGGAAAVELAQAGDRTSALRDLGRSVQCRHRRPYRDRPRDRPRGASGGRRRGAPWARHRTGGLVLVLVLMLAGLLLREDRDGDRDDRAGLLRWRLLVCNRVAAIDED